MCIVSIIVCAAQNPLLGYVHKHTFELVLKLVTGRPITSHFRSIPFVLAISLSGNI